MKGYFLIKKIMGGTGGGGGGGGLRVLKGFHRCQGIKGMSQAPGWLLHQLVEQHVALTGRHLVFTDRGDTRKKGRGERGVIISACSYLPTRSTSQHPGSDQDTNPAPTARHCALLGLRLWERCQSCCGDRAGGE